MAIHHDLTSLIRESLPEYLWVAEYCVGFRKDGSWPHGQVGGCLGYPAAAMLFSIVDAIGSFHRGRDDAQFMVGGRSHRIKNHGFHHFYVLNGDYYSQTLEEAEIKKLYDNFRCLLLHNAALAPGHFLLNQPHVSEAFPRLEGKIMVNVSGFLGISRGAVHRFLSSLDALVPGSRQADNINLKR